MDEAERKRKDEQEEKRKEEERYKEVAAREEVERKYQMLHLKITRVYICRLT